MNESDLIALLQPLSFNDVEGKQLAVCWVYITKSRQSDQLFSGPC